jgi:GTP-binding protein EngB required for normal cell division
VAEPSPQLLNPSQVRHLLAVFTQVDQGLARSEVICAGRTSPFARERADLAPEEGRLFTAFIGGVRARMLEACDRLGVARPEPTISARWSVETTLQFAGISFAELSPEKMRGYGPLPAGAEEELSALSGALDALASRGVALVRGAEATLTSRSTEVVGRAGVILRAIEQLASEHGLYEVHVLLAAAIERASARTLDVGVFGRVSSGKSSLLNALLGQEVLPVGITPVTAVPVFVERGDPGLRVHFSSGGVRAASVDQIRAYAAEEGNPSNTKDVREVLVRVPSAPSGVRFLDTPGVGSLSSSGPALAFAALPRCDLGLVLISAGAALGPDDLAVIQALRGAGIQTVLLASKADLLTSDERTQAAGHLASELDRALGPSHGVEVYPVSTRPGDEALISAFRAWVLEPAARAHRLGSERALGRRLGRLIALTEEALASRNAAGLSREMELERMRRATLEAIQAHIDGLARAGPALFQCATTRLAAAWRRGEDGTGCVRDALMGAPGEALASLRSLLDGARAAFCSDDADTKKVPPLFDPPLLRAMPDLRPPALGRQLLTRRRASRRLASLAGPLQSALSAHAGNLRSWAEGTLNEVTREAPRPTGIRSPGEGPLAGLAAMARTMEGVTYEDEVEPPPAVQLASSIQEGV